MKLLSVAVVGCLSLCSAYDREKQEETVTSRATEKQRPTTTDQCPLFAAVAGTVPAELSEEQRLVCPSIQALRKWKALKFGLFMHWGPFAQPVPYDGVYPGASWRLNYQTAYMFWKRANGSNVCPPQNWTDIKCPTKEQMREYRESYWSMAETFRPSEFDADRLLSWARGVGFRYIVPTTKHHDGFAMFRTSAVGDPAAVGTPAADVYGVGGPKTATDRDLIGEIAAAARRHGVVFGAYFSKADWHAGSYWVKKTTTPSTSAFPAFTGPNYNITGSDEERQRFAAFKNFTAVQLEEIVTK